MSAAPAASSATNRAPSLLAAVLRDVFKPFAGTAPNAPTPESPLSWIWLRRRADNFPVPRSILTAPSAITASPTFTLNGDTITPVYPVTVTGIYNKNTALPGVDESIQGYQKFNVVDANGNPAGTFYGYVSTNPYLASPSEASTSSQVIYVDSGIAISWATRPARGLCRTAR